MNLHPTLEKQCHKHEAGKKIAVHKLSDSLTFTSLDEHSTKLITAPPKAVGGIITEDHGLPLRSTPFTNRQNGRFINTFEIKEIKNAEAKSWFVIKIDLKFNQ